MRTPYLIAILLVFSQAPTNGQELPFDLRMGVGRTLLTLYSYGNTVTSGEVELNYAFSPRFTVAVSIGEANRGARDFLPKVNYLRTDLSLLWSPFGNRRRHDFRLGGGASYLSIYSPSRSQVTTVNEVVRAIYTYERKGGVGYAAIVEHSYAITPRLLVGGRVAARLYTTYDGNVDALLKVGIRF